MVTWPSAMSTALFSLRTHKTVVPCISALPGLLRIPTVYTGSRSKHAAGLTSLEGDLFWFREESYPGFSRAGGAGTAEGGALGAVLARLWRWSSKTLTS